MYDFPFFKYFDKIETVESKYQLPFPKSTKFKIAKPKGDYAHENFPEIKYAIDFVVPADTPVLAIKSGKVTNLKNDSNEWGLDFNKYADKVNFVEIEHENETFAEYFHLGKDKVKVKIGDKIKAGDLIAYTGFSGLMDRPHLHLNVFRIRNGKAISIPIGFEK